jgi:hypothetical protein
LGFGLIFLLLLFYSAFTFTLSSLTRNSISTLLIPIFYIFFQFLFIQWDMELLSFSYYTNLFYESFFLYSHIGRFLTYNPTIFTIAVIVYILSALLLFLGSVHGFNLIEITPGWCGGEIIANKAKMEVWVNLRVLDRKFVPVINSLSRS